jgi:isopenicillin-N N-acyltransferase-like protein
MNGIMAQSVKQSPLEKLKLTGTPYERGVKHGEEYADQIKENVDLYLDVFEYKGSDEETVYEQADEFTPLIEDENKEYAEEMRGVAEGSNLPIEDITILNARYEVMYSAFASAAEELNEEPQPGNPDACTAFGVRPEITADGNTYIGQNWDWTPGIHTFVMDIQRNDKPNMVAMTEAGIVGGKIGVNEHGIGMTLNGLVTEKDGEEPFRKPYHVRFREVLDSEQFADASEALIAKDRACSGNVILGHGEGEMINFELAPETANYLYPEDDLLTHANHVEDTSSMDSEFEKLIPDTLCRAPRLRRLLSKEKGNLNFEVFQEAFQDHFDRPSSICRHPNEKDDELERLQTNGSYVLDLTNRRMRGTNGPPCENEYIEFEVAT